MEFEASTVEIANAKEAGRTELAHDLTSVESGPMSAISRQLQDGLFHGMVPDSVHVDPPTHARLPGLDQFSTKRRHLARPIACRISIGIHRDQDNVRQNHPHE